MRNKNLWSMLIFLALIATVMAGVHWNSQTTQLILPTVANDTLAAGDSVNIGTVAVNWSRWDWAEIKVAVDIDSVARVDWKVETSPDGTNWTVLTKSLDATIQDGAIGASGVVRNLQDSTTTLYFVRPTIGPGAAAQGLAMDTAEPRNLMFAEYIRVNWFKCVNVDSTDSTTLDVTFRLGDANY